MKRLLLAAIIFTSSVVPVGAYDFSMSTPPPPGAIRVLAQSAVAVPLTGSASETVLATVTIKGGTLKKNGTLRVTALFSAGAVNANAKTLRIRFGASGTSATAYFSASIANQKSGQGFILIRNRNDESSQVGHSAFVYGAGGDASNAPTTTSLNTTQDQTITFTGQLGSAGDTLTMESYCIELLPGVN